MRGDFQCAIIALRPVAMRLPTALTCIPLLGQVIDTRRNFSRLQSKLQRVSVHTISNHLHHLHQQERRAQTGESSGGSHGSCDLCGRRDTSAFLTALCGAWKPMDLLRG